MTITAAQVKELRTATGAPMMDCKTALTEANGDMDVAVDWLRARGVEVAGKKSGRDTDQGLVGVNVDAVEGMVATAVIVEVNCETDFVAKNEIFQEFVSDYAALQQNGVPFDLSVGLTTLVATVGENIQLGRNASVQGEVVASYVHNQVAEGLGTIGVIVALNGIPSDELAVVAKDIAMHIAATNPKAVDESSLDQEWLAHEKQIFVDQAKDSGKPDSIIEKMVGGRMQKVIRENTLVSQSFVKDADTTVGKLLAANGASVVDFVRFAIGD